MILYSIRIMEPKGGIEPPTYALPRRSAEQICGRDRSGRPFPTRFGKHDPVIVPAGGGRAERLPHRVSMRMDTRVSGRRAARMERIPLSAGAAEGALPRLSGGAVSWVYRGVTLTGKNDLEMVSWPGQWAGHRTAASHPQRF